MPGTDRGSGEGPRLRGIAVLAAAGAVAAGGLIAVAPAASAAPQTISGATFEWGLSDYIQYTGTGQGCHWLSAGTTPTADAAGYSTQSGNVTILKNGAQPADFASRCAGGVGYDPQNPTPLNQKVVWTGGTGTRDSETGASAISFTGTLAIKFSGQTIRIIDPTLTLNADGTGSLVASTRVGTALTEATPTSTNVVVAELSGVNTGDSTGFSRPPTYYGRTVTLPVGTNPPVNTMFPTQAAQDLIGSPGGTPAWGAFPQSWLSAIESGGDGSRFYSSLNSGGTARSTLDALKAPSAITVTYGTLTDPPETEDQTISVTVPEVVGEYVWAIDGDQAVDLGETTDEGAYLQAAGTIDPIGVTDNRIGGPVWSISGQVSDFTPALDGKYLGWTPEVTSSGAGAVAGAAVAPGMTSGNGLKDSSVLASSPGGHARGSATLGAALDLQIPVETPPGAYSATLTLTALT